jgi:hypothetical protein
LAVAPVNETEAPRVRTPLSVGPVGACFDPQPAAASSTQATVAPAISLVFI